MDTDIEARDMKDSRKVLIQLVVALLIGLAGMGGTLLLFSQGANARHMLDLVSLSISKNQSADSINEDPADLAVIKSGNPNLVIAGETLTYVITVTNNGPDPATGVVLTDILPSGVTCNTATASQGSCNILSGGTVTCTLFDLGTLLIPTATVNIVVTVDPSTTGTLANTATVSGNETDPDPSNNTATEETTVDTETDLAITKSGNPSTVIAGETLTYILTASNNGPSDATGVTVTDILPSDVSFASASASEGSCSHASGEVTCDLGSLADGAGTTITIVATVASPLPSGTILTNDATIGGDQTDPNGGNNSAQVQTTVESAPILRLIKSDDPDPALAGGNLIYTIAISNTGNENATAVTLVETYDPNVSFDRAWPNPDVENNQWNIGTVEVGTPVAVTILVRVASLLPVGTVLTNQATLDSAQTSPITVIETTDVESESDLWVTQTDNPDPVEAGATLNYYIRYENTGTVPASGVVLTDTLDSNVTFLSAYPSPSGGTGNTRYWVIGDLPAGDPRDIVVRVQVKSPLPNGTLLYNSVTIRSNEDAPPPFIEPTQVTSAPDLTVAADHTPSLFSPGKLMTYTVTYGNTGNMHAEDVVITTTLPLSTTYVGYGWNSSDGQTYTYPVGYLSAGDTGHTVTFAVQYPSQPQIGMPEFNTPFIIAETGSAVGDANPDDNTTYEYIGVPDLVVTDFTVEPSPLQPGQPVTFTAVVKNQGTGMAWNPDNQGGFYVDVLVAPVVSYPFDRYSEKDIYADVPSLASGQTYTVILAYPSGFTQWEIEHEIKGFFLKVDNYHLPLYGLVPERDEMNNVEGPVYPWLQPEVNANDVYLPLIFKQ